MDEFSSDTVWGLKYLNNLIIGTSMSVRYRTVKIIYSNSQGVWRKKWLNHLLGSLARKTGRNEEKSHEDS